MRYEGDIYRPPSEAHSYLLQCTIGCSHNRCTFCNMYKDKQYRVRSLEEIKADIKMAKGCYRDLKKVFLCDGDVLAMETSELIEIIGELYRSFPGLTHVGIYASPASILNKDHKELVGLKQAGLTMAYLGVETGAPRLLKEICKGVTAEEMEEAGVKIRQAGILLSVTVILGLAGRSDKAKIHAIKTAELLNQINPDYIGALTLMLNPGTALYHQMEKGAFQLPAPFEILTELKWLIEGLEVKETEFRSNHASNYLPIKGRLPYDKETILDMINSVLENNSNQALRPEYLRGL